MAFVAAGAAIAGLGSGIYSGEVGRKQQKKALRSQQQAQARSEARATSQQRRSEQEQRRLNRRQPDLMGILGRARQSALQGTGSTLLTGPGGVPKGRVALGQSSLLGGA
jgi:hypothetical protein